MRTKNTYMSLIHAIGRGGARKLRLDGLKNLVGAEKFDAYKSYKLNEHNYKVTN